MARPRDASSELASLTQSMRHKHYPPNITSRYLSPPNYRRSKLTAFGLAAGNSALKSDLRISCGRSRKYCLKTMGAFRIMSKITRRLQANFSCSDFAFAYACNKHKPEIYYSLVTGFSRRCNKILIRLSNASANQIKLLPRITSRKQWITSNQLSHNTT